MVLNGTVGARLHVSFPVLNRSSFGFWFAYFSVISRVVLAMFWFGIQTFVGSECVYQVRLASEARVILLSLSSFYVALPSDVESHLAVYSSSPKPPPTQCKHHHCWYVSTGYAPESGQLSRCLFYRDDLLLSVLAHSVPFYAHLTAEDTLAFFGESNHCATDMASIAYLGVCQSAPKQWYPCAKGEAEWQCALMGLVERAQ